MIELPEATTIARQMGAVGQPCPRCRAPIEKASYLGGAIYFCPTCQAE